MTGALRMEWTKLRTVRTAVWSVVALVAFSLGLGALTVWSLDGPCPPACDADAAKLSLMSLAVNNEHWRELLQRYSPMTAGLAIQATKGLDDLPIGPWAGLAVLACYAAGALLVAAVLIRIRDA